jgi:pimeloyl-ACP methyl ester carboxylesterase
LSRSKIAWCIDPVPARGGDPVEAQAIAKVIRDRVSVAFPTRDKPAAATLIGWSHGGGEALRAAVHDPDLFPQFLGLCPTGLVDKRQSELLRSFFLEATRILWESARRRDWALLKDTIRLGWNAGAGLVRDLWRGRSAQRLVEDLDWAARKVASGPIGYTGEVVLLFGAQDIVVRWRDVFPECRQPQDIPGSLAEYRERKLPHAKRVEVQVLEGAHVAPEADPSTFLQAGLSLLGQWDGAEQPLTSAAAIPAVGAAPEGNADSGSTAAKEVVT